MLIKKIMFYLIVAVSCFGIINCSGGSPKQAPEDFIKKYITTQVKLDNAEIDFSGLSITIVDEKDEYVNDESKHFAKIETAGSYKVKIAGSVNSRDINDTFILMNDRGEWKISEQVNPWL